MNTIIAFLIGLCLGGLVVGLYYRHLLYELRKGAGVAGAYLNARRDDFEKWLSGREEASDATLHAAWTKAKARLRL